jgi:hypothetical protein
MRNQVNAIRAKLTAGIVRYRKNATNMTNVDSSDESREAGLQKPQTHFAQSAKIFDSHSCAMNTHDSCMRSTIVKSGLRTCT